MSLPLPTAQLIGVFLESVSYGAYMMIFIQCMQVLRRRQFCPSDYLVGTSVSLFVLVTAHLVIDIIRCMDAFTSHTATPNYAVKYYAEFDTWQNIARSALYVLVTIISDLFILCRCFIVWGRNYFITAIPFMLFLADIAIGIFWVYTITLILPGDSVFTDVIAERIKIFYGITLGLNVICTCLIAFRIWRIQRGVAPFVKVSQNNLSRLVAIVVESGSVYSAFLVAMITTYSVNSTVMFILLNTISPVIGIVFSYVIVRIGSGLSHGDTRDPGSHTTGSRTWWSTRQLSSVGQTALNQPLTPTTGSFPDRGIQVALSQTVHTRVDEFTAKGIQKDLPGSPDDMYQSFMVI